MRVTPGDFNPFSVDAQLATIITELKTQKAASEAMHEENKKVQGEILVQAKKTNGRVTKLEHYVAAIVGGAFVIGVLWAVFTHFVK
ncbi:MAG: hypothetical protein V7609_2074 [Verrucomicrobiota bacterium]